MHDDIENTSVEISWYFEARLLACCTRWQKVKTPNFMYLNGLNITDFLRQSLKSALKSHMPRQISAQLDQK